MGELAICDRYRISHSHFLGGPASWTATDRALAKAYKRHRDELCSNCRTKESWWDPKQGGDRNVLVADTHRCEGCARKAELQEQIPREAKGTYVVLVPPQEASEL